MTWKFVTSGIAAAAICVGGVEVACAAPPVAPSYWSGWYVGVSGGEIWQDHNVSPFVSGAPGPQSTPTQAAIASTLNAHSQSAIVGGELGFNNLVQDHWVFGIETDFSWTDLNANSTVTNLTTVIGRGRRPITTTASESMDWLGTTRFRGGYLVTPAVLVYATGGVAYGGTSSSLGVSSTGVVPFSVASSSSDVEGGFTVGGGIEWAFAPRWAVKAEYLYYQLSPVTLGLSRPNNTPPGFNVSSSFDFAGSIVRGGVSYKFQ